MTFESGLINDVRKQGDVVVKNINPIAPHAREESDYKIIEGLKKKFSANDVPVVQAKEINGLQIIYPYINNAKVLYSALGPTSDEHATIAGQLLGKMHSLNIREFDKALKFNFLTSQSELLEIISRAKNTEWIKKIDIKKFLDINQQCIQSMKKLSENLIFSHCDFYPHNILWGENNYYLIDWEFAGLINPGLEFVLARLCMGSGHQLISSERNSKSLSQKRSIDVLTPCAFTEAYFSTGAKIEDDMEDCFWGAINNGWVYWIVYNMKIALDEQFDKNTREKAKENVVTYFIGLMGQCRHSEGAKRL